MLEGGAFSSKEFAEWSKTVVPFLHITTRIEDREGDDLLSDLADRTAFPTVMVLDAAGEKLAEVNVLPLAGYQRLVDSAQRYLAAKKKVDGGDAAAKVDMHIASAELGMIDIDELDEELEGKTLTDVQKRAVTQVRHNTTVSDIGAAMRRRGRDAEFLKMAAAECLAIHKTGVHPNNAFETMYWTILARSGYDAKNVELVGAAVAALRGIAQEDKRVAKRLAQVEGWLKELEAG